VKRFAPSGSRCRVGSRTRALSEAHSDPKPQNWYTLSTAFLCFFAHQVTLKSGLSADPARQRAILQPFLEEARSLGISHDIVDAAHSKLKVSPIVAIDAATLNAFFRLAPMQFAGACRGGKEVCIHHPVVLVGDAREIYRVHSRSRRCPPEQVNPHPATARTIVLIVTLLSVCGTRSSFSRSSTPCRTVFCACSRPPPHPNPLSPMSAPAVLSLLSLRLQQLLVRAPLPQFIAKLVSALFRAAIYTGRCIVWFAVNKVPHLCSVTLHRICRFSCAFSGRLL
jgi:hypothetical protein